MNPSTTLRSSASDHLPPPPPPNLDDTVRQTSDSPTLANQDYHPCVEDILNDEQLLDFFRSIKRLLQKKPSTDLLAKIIFCFWYTLRGHVVQFNKQANEDRIVFREHSGACFTVHLASVITTISAPHSSSSSPPNKHAFSSSHTSGSSGLPTAHLSSMGAPSGQRIAPKYTSHDFPRQSLSVPYLTTPTTPYPISESRTPPPLLPSGKTRNTPSPPLQPPSIGPSTTSSSSSSTTTTPTFIHMTPQFPFTDHHRAADAQSSPSSSTHFSHAKPPTLPQPTPTYPSILRTQSYHHRPPRHPTVTSMIHSPDDEDDSFAARNRNVVKREAEDENAATANGGQLTNGGGARKRKRRSAEQVGSPGGEGGRKNKTPHRHGEFEQRRDDILHRLQTITVQELTHKAARLPLDFTLSVDSPKAPTTSPQERLTQSLCALSRLSNMKPHLDNGMNQNGIYYNSDYYRLYLAFEQFQNEFARANPDSAVSTSSGGGVSNSSDAPATPTSPSVSKSGGADREKDRNTHMKSYRALIEPRLTDTNWAAFRRNIVVGERMVQLTEVAGKGVLLMTKELSGSKLHLTFTNHEWEAFVDGLKGGVFTGGKEGEGGEPKVVDVTLLKEKFKSDTWFDGEGRVRRELVITGGERFDVDGGRREGSDRTSEEGTGDDDEDDEVDEMDEDDEEDDRDVEMSDRGRGRGPQETARPNDDASGSGTRLAKNDHPTAPVGANVTHAFASSNPASTGTGISRDRAPFTASQFVGVHRQGATWAAEGEDRR